MHSGTRRGTDNFRCEKKISDKKYGKENHPVMNIAYCHTQFGTVMVASLLGAAMLVAAACFRTGWNLVTGLMEFFVFGCALLFCCLTVEITADEVVCPFGPGLIGKRFMLLEIRDVKAVKNPWYYGWGIRLTPHGWLFNVSGLNAVEIELASGRTFRVGTDRPDELAQAIRKGSSN